jgi:hypothetical protein
MLDPSEYDVFGMHAADTLSIGVGGRSLQNLANTVVNDVIMFESPPLDMTTWRQFHEKEMLQYKTFLGFVDGESMQTADFRVDAAFAKHRPSAYETQGAAPAAANLPPETHILPSSTADGFVTGGLDASAFQVGLQGLPRSDLPPTEDLAQPIDTMGGMAEAPAGGSAEKAPSRSGAFRWG